MVGHIVGCASEWNLPDRPWGIIGQVCRQDTDPQLSLGVQWTAESVEPGVDKGRVKEPRPPKNVL